jgi:hypothetical protein
MYNECMAVSSSAVFLRRQWRYLKKSYRGIVMLIAVVRIILLLGRHGDVKFLSKYVRLGLGS